MTSWIRGGLLLALAVCGSMGCGHPAPQPVTHTVTIDGVRFEPAALTVRPGDVVIWVNHDPFPHTVTGPGTLTSPDIGASERWQWTAAGTGDLPYVCKYHPTMTAVITVAP
jgi:plastocyanin